MALHVLISALIASSTFCGHAATHAAAAAVSLHKLCGCSWLGLPPGGVNGVFGPVVPGGIFGTIVPGG